MALTGWYLARMIHRVSLPPLRTYRDIALARVLPAFGNLEAEANAFAQQRQAELYQEASADEDPASLDAQAHEDAVDFFVGMSKARQGVFNLLTAGFFHLFEQQLGIVFHDATIVAMGVASPQLRLHEVVAWMRDHAEFDLRASAFWDDLEILRLVANTAKHAEGNSAEQLRERRPDLLACPDFTRLTGLPPKPVGSVRTPLAGDDLFVNEEVFTSLTDNALASLAAIRDHFDARANDEFPK